jgi:N-glycosylase/DNA lyase
VKLATIRAPDFNLEKTLNSGQVFHWQKVGSGFVGTIGDGALYLEQRGEFLKVRFGAPPTKSPRRLLPGIVERYFALDHPLAEICDSFPKDPVPAIFVAGCGSSGNQNGNVSPHSFVHR